MVISAVIWIIAVFLLKEKHQLFIKRINAIGSTALLKEVKWITRPQRAKFKKISINETYISIWYLYSRVKYDMILWSLTNL